MAVELATAYISLVPSARGFSEKVRQEIGAPLEKAAKESGERAGAELEKGVTGSLSGIATKLAAAFATVKVGGFLKGAVDSAVDVGEQLSKLNVLVGDSSTDIDEWSKTMAESFGLSRRSALVAAGDFANFFRGVGKSTTDAAKMSKQFVELAADMASFSNTTPQEALDALAAALRGESEPIRRFGVLLDDATLKQRAFNEGLTDSTTGALTPAIRLQAAYAEVLAQTTAQQGDSARTATSLANQQRRLSAEFEDVKTTLGQGLLPIVQRVVSAFADGLLPAFKDAVPTIVEMVNSTFDAGAAIGGLLAPLSGVGVLLGEFALGAGGALFALDKIAAGVKTAQAAFVAFQATSATLTGGLSLLTGVLAGGLLLAFTAYSANAAEAKADQQGLTKALLDAGDPTQRLVSELGGLVDQLGKMGDKSKGAKDAVNQITEAQVASIAASEGTIAAFNDLGISAKQMVDLTRDGGKAFGDAAQQALNLANGNSELALATERATGPQKELIDRLFEMNKQGKISGEQLADLFGTLNRVSDAYRHTAEANKSSLQGDLERAKALGVVNDEWEKQQRNASGVADEYGQLTFIGNKLTEVLKAQGVEAPTASAGLDAVAASSTAAGSGQETAAQAADRLAKSQDAAKDAAKAHDAAMKGLTDTLKTFVDGALSAEETDDKWTKTTAQLIDNIQKQKAANQDGAASLTGFTQAALDNRDTMRELVSVAEEDIQKKIEQGATIDQVKARAAELSQALLTNADNLGINRDEAQRYADVILNAGNTVAGLNAQLGALPTQMQLDLEIAVHMNLDEFHAKLAEISQSFQDPASAAAVAAGILELPGAQFNLSGRASGGPVTAGQPVIVGEHGKELWWPDTSGWVVPHDQLASVGGGGGVQFGDIVVNGAQASPAAIADAVFAKAGWKHFTGRRER